MTTLTIELPENLAVELQRRTAAAGFDRPGDYIAALLLERPSGADVLAELPAWAPHTWDQIEAKVLKSLDSGEDSTPMAAEDWDALRRQCRERASALRQAGT